jgi:hypothetical protein
MIKLGGVNRRLFLSSLAAVGVGALWWQRDWLPERGVLNPCRESRLPDAIAAHPAVVDALRDLDLAKVWDGHVHLVGIGDSHPRDLWVNPAMGSPWHPLQFLQERLYMNASCVARAEGTDDAYVRRLQSLLDAKWGGRGAANHCRGQ